MSGLEFVTTLVGTLAWPLAVVICAVLFRHPLRGLLQRLTTLEAPGGIKVAFGEQLADVAERVAAVANRSQPSTGSDGPLDQTAGWGLLLGRADSSPRDAVLDAWTMLDRQLNLVCDRMDPHCTNDWIQVERTLGRLTQWPALRPAVAELRSLRDATAHGSAVPSTSDAVRYVSLSRDLVTTLNMIMATLPPRPGPRDGGPSASDGSRPAEEARSD